MNGAFVRTADTLTCISPKLHVLVKIFNATINITNFVYKVYRATPEHFQHQLSCGVGNRVSFLWRHRPDGEVRIRLCHGHQCFQEKPEERNEERSMSHGGGRNYFGNQIEQD